MLFRLLALCLCCFTPLMIAAKPKAKEPTALQQYLQEMEVLAHTHGTGTTPGSLWTREAPLGNLGADFRARFVGDLVTVLVIDRASAVARGTTKTTRSSEASGSASILGGAFDPTGKLRDLASLQSETQLDGQGETSRETLLRTSLTARVSKVLPNGYLLVEGTKTVSVNSEAQIVTVRGIVRPVDISSGNTVASDSLGLLEVAVNGKGVVGDAIRRPNFLYRLLLGLLPF